MREASVAPVLRPEAFQNPFAEMLLFAVADSAKELSRTMGNEVPNEEQGSCSIGPDS